ncbi:ABC transporter substrate-binding protein [Desulfobacterales bacterium HSG17]|nr:ABC transporter substrate-binding protein [Desulfobacterales bacterium HSG17]
MLQDKINRRKFIKTGAAALASLSMSPMPVFGSEDEVLRIGYLPITDAAPIVIAHAKGFYQEEGLQVAMPTRVRSWSTLTESFMTGKFNLTHMLLPIPIWMRYKNHAPVKVLAWDHTNGSAITVRADSKISGFADLGGKQIAVPYWYSMHNIILQLGLRKIGLKPVIQPQSVKLKPNEVNLFILPPPEMPISLAGKKIDGFIVAEPFNAVSEIKIGARIMRFTGDIWKNHPCCVVVMNERFPRTKPEYTQKVVNAIVRAQLWITDNLEETAEILSREGKGYLPVPKKILVRVFTGYDIKTYGRGTTPQAIKHPEWNISRIGFQPYPYPSATAFIVEQMRDTIMEGNAEFLKKIDPDFVAKDLADDRFVKNAIVKFGGFDNFPEINIESPWDREEIIEV